MKKVSYCDDLIPFFNRSEDLLLLPHTCEDLVPILQICENLVPIHLRKIVPVLQILKKT